MADLNLKDILQKNKDNEDVQNFLKENAPQNEVTLDVIKQFVESDEAGKNWLKSHTDSYITKAIDTYKEKTLPKMVEEKYQSMHPEETEEQKINRELKQRLDAIEKEAKQERLLNKAMKYAVENKIPDKFIDRFLGEDEDSTYNNLNELKTYLDDMIKQQLENKATQNVRQRPVPDGGEQETITAKQLLSMKPEERSKLSPEVIKNILSKQY